MSDGKNLMNSVQTQLLYCLAAYRLGSTPARLVPDLSAEDWVQLRQLAGMHKMAPMVFDALRQAPGFCGGDQEMIRAWKRDTMLQAAGQAMRSARIVQITAAMQKAGIRYAVLKGLVCRELYSSPDLRLSGDEDVLIDPADRTRSHEILAQCGCTMFMGDEDVTHWQDPSSGLHIELHSRLLSREDPEEDRLNSSMMEQLNHTVPAATAGGPVQTFAPTWHFVFLVCHALKHFLTGGVGIRTLCDIISFAERYQEEIDVPAAEKMLQGISGRVFLDQIFAIGEQWLGFDPAACGWQYSRTPDPEELLLDCLDAGIYGQSSMSRKHSAELVLQAKETGSKRTHLGSALFPPRKNLVRRYPELERWPVLLPVCWVRRIVTYGKEVGRSQGGNSPLESMAMGRQRTEMMAKYGIINRKK